MPRLNRPPKLGLHKASGQACVHWQGKRHYLGKYGSVEGTLPQLPAVVADMVRFQRLTGCRPGEVCSIRQMDVDRSAEVWLYRPEDRKTAHHDRERTIFIGPKAQSVLMPDLLRPADSFCFSPAEAEKQRLAELHAARVTPMNCGNKPGSNKVRHPKRRPGDRS